MLHARTLYYLDEVARCGSIRKAAERLNVSPTAINKQILLLEAQQGTALFERMPRGMRLTAAGELLMAHVRRTLRDHRHLERQIERLHGRQGGEVKIAIADGLAGLLAGVTLAYLEMAPHVRVTVTTAGAAAMAALLREGEVDLALGYDLPADPRLGVLETIDARIGAVVAPGHPLAAEPAVRLADCLPYPLVAGDVTLPLHRAIAELLARADMDAAATQQTNSIDFMKMVVAQGHAVALLTAHDVVAEVRAATLAYLPLRGEAARVPLILARNARRVPSVAAERLGHAVIDALRLG